jgi:hypothetical protein
MAQAQMTAASAADVRFIDISISNTAHRTGPLPQKFRPAHAVRRCIIGE